MAIRAQLNKVGPKELCSWLGAWPLNTTHVWPRSTAPKPDGIYRQGVHFEVGGKPEYPEKNLSQIEIDWNSAHIGLEARVEPGSQRWELRLMTTKPPWLPSPKCWPRLRVTYTTKLSHLPVGASWYYQALHAVRLSSVVQTWWIGKWPITMM